MDYMYELKEKLCKELDSIAKKPDMSAGDLETVHKLTDTIKNIDKIDMLEDGGYSQNGDWSENSSYGRGSSYANRGRHLVRAHYSRRGGYSREGYSRDGAKDRMMDHLEEMMQDASSEKERDAIRRCMSQIENA